jgi:hypothetical protein
MFIIGYKKADINIMSAQIVEKGVFFSRQFFIRTLFIIEIPK